MWFKIQRELLLKALQLIIGVVEKKQNNPVLAHVQLKILETGMALCLSATDLEMEWVTTVELNAEKPVEPGEISIPARKLMDICRTLPEGAFIEIHREKQRIVLLSNKSRFVLAILSQASFPTLKEGANTTTFKVPTEVLQKLLEQVSFAMAQQDVRYYLNGLLFVFDPKGVRVVATDGHRLATLLIPVDLDIPERQTAILPRKAVMELNRLFQELEPTVEIELGAHCLRVATLKNSFTTKLIDGKFPNYLQVLPTKTQYTAIASRENLKDALIRASVLFSDRFRGARLSFYQNTLKILACNQDKDEVEVELEVVYEGPLLEIGFNISYLIEYLNIIKSPEVILKLNDPNGSVVFEAYGPGAEQYSIYVVMPMRL